MFFSLLMKHISTCDCGCKAGWFGKMGMTCWRHCSQLHVIASDSVAIANCAGPPYIVRDCFVSYNDMIINVDYQVCFLNVETHNCVSRMQITHANHECKSLMKIGLANSEYPAGDAIMRLYNSPIRNHVITIFSSPGWWYSQ